MSEAHREGPQAWYREGTDLNSAERRDGTGGGLCPHFGLYSHFCPHVLWDKPSVVSSLPTRWLFFSKGTARDKSIDPSFLCWGGDSSPPELLRGHKERSGLPGHTCPRQKCIYLLRRRDKSSDPPPPTPPVRDLKHTIACLEAGRLWPLCCRFCSKVDPGRQQALEQRARRWLEGVCGGLTWASASRAFEFKGDSSRVVGCPACSSLGSHFVPTWSPIPNPQ